MLKHSEFILIHHNIPFPEEETLCPFIWNSEEQWDSDGDYYFYKEHFFEQDPRYWTDLSLKIDDTEFDLYTFREYPGFSKTTGNSDQIELEEYILQFRNGKFGNLKGIDADLKLAVTYIKFSTKNSEHYALMLESVYEFLRFIKGVLLKPFICYGDEFETRIMKNAF